MKPYQQDSIHITYYANIYEQMYDIPIYQNAAKGKSVLELACGTGRVLNALSSARSRVGIDNSLKMLDVARNGQKVELILGDILEPNIDQKFELVILALKTINMFDRAERLKILQNMAKLMEPKGWAMIHASFWTENVTPPPSIKSWNTPNGTVTRTQVNSITCKEQQTVEATMVYELQDTNGSKTREEENFKIYLPSQTQFIEEATIAGLQVLGYYNLSSYERIALFKLHQGSDQQQAR